MINAPVMVFPRDEDTYILNCDASLESIGAVLSQIQDGEEKIIAYASRLYSEAERNYCVTRRELLAMVYFCKYFKQYLLGRDFLIRTDHSALTWLRKTPDQIGQQSRWLEQLEEFTFRIEHQSGSKHTNADAMSKRPCRQCHRIDDEDEVEVNGVQAIRVNIENKEEEWTNEFIAEAQKQDQNLGEFYVLKKEYKEVKPEFSEIEGKGEVCKTLWNQWNKIVMRDDVLYRTPLTNNGEDRAQQIILPPKLRRLFWKPYILA